MEAGTDQLPSPYRLEGPRTPMSIQRKMNEADRAVVGQPSLYAAVTSSPREQEATSEWLKSDLASQQLRSNCAEVEARLAEAERVRLVRQVVGLEAENRKHRDEADNWRARCLDSEQKCATLTVKEDMAQGELRESVQRERELAVRSIERRLAVSEAECVQGRAENEAKEYLWQVKKLEHDVHAKSEEVDALRKELRDVWAQSEVQRVSLQQIEAQYSALRSERDQQYEALCNANRRSGTLEARVENLQADVRAATAKQSELTSDAAGFRTRSLRLEEANRRLRLDLQESIGQATRTGEIPFYSGGPVRAAAAGLADADASSPHAFFGMASPSGERSLPPSSYSLPASPQSARTPRCRLDYPKSSTARQLRVKVLNAREEGLDRADRAGFY